MRVGQYYLVKYYDKIVAVKLVEKYECGGWRGWKINPSIPEYMEYGDTLVAITKDSPHIIKKLTKEEFEQSKIEEQI